MPVWGSTTICRTPIHSATHHTLTREKGIRKVMCVRSEPSGLYVKGFKYVIAYVSQGRGGGGGGGR